MHKYISLILALVITLLSVGNVYAEEENNDILISYIMNESFDSCNISEVGQGIVAVPKNNSLGVDSFPSAENKSLKYTVKSFDDSYIDIGLMALTGKVIVEYDVYFDNNGDGVFALFLKNAKNEESEICHFDKSLNLSTASGIQKCKCRTGRFYNVCSVINTETGCADVYVNHKMRINGEKIGNGDFKDVSLLRVHSYAIGQGTKPVVYVDNLKIYQSEYPVFMYENMGKNILEDNNNANQKIASEENMIKYMGNAVALYVNQPKIYADGEVSYINEEDKNEKPYIYIMTERLFR